MKQLSTVILIFFGSSVVLCQGIDFYKEDIVFKVNNGYLYVDGYYWFANTSNEKIGSAIYFPFRDINESGAVDSVSVYRIPQGEFQQINDLNNFGFSFRMELSAKDTSTYQISYRQKIIGDSAKYILRSTQSWNKPLKAAEYKLIVNPNIDVIRFSYEPDNIYNIDGKKIYYWKRNDFLPGCDMIFHFRNN